MYHGSRATYPGTDRACDPSLYEPNLALNLEVSDLVNQKKGNFPREAAVAIVQHVNSRDQHIALLALTLLDICVKNCGYPFHLQIASKDFLNELVRRFPERPPPRPSRAQRRILEMIEEWRATIVHSARDPKDFAHIRDMHRLLRMKGYTFPQVTPDAQAVLGQSDRLKSAEELEAEDREIQQARLQELIRKGTKRDLAEANQLMKILSGYDSRNKTDYRAKVAEELEQLRSKTQLLKEFLATVQENETIGQGDVFEDLAMSIKASRPKLQQMIQDESEDAEAVAKLLELGGMIDANLEKYDKLRKGDYAGASQVTVKATSTPPPRANGGPTSLIDFEGELGGSQGSATSSKDGDGTGNLLDDLAGLSFNSTPAPFGQGGSIALGQDTSIFSSSPSNTPGRAASPAIHSTSPMNKPSTPDYSAFASLQQFNSTPRSTSQTFSPPAYSQPKYTPQASRHTPTPSTDDDFGTFASAVPESPSSRVILSDSPNLTITLEATRSSPTSPITMTARFSNKRSQRVEDLTFQMAVPKIMRLTMNPLSSRTLSPMEKDGISQISEVGGAPAGIPALKVRFKVSFKINGEVIEESGRNDQVAIT